MSDSRHICLASTRKNTELTSTMPSVQDVFEVERIIADKRFGGETLYLVRWRNTVTTDLRLFLEQYRGEIKNVFAVDRRLSIVWHDTWLPEHALQESCDEILAAYLLLKLFEPTRS